MGANPYCYFTDFDSDIQAALDNLRSAELAAGRYEPCFYDKTGKWLFEYGLAPRDTFPAPGGCHDTIEEVFADLDPSGSNSILDIFEVAADPFPFVDDPMSAPDTFDRMNRSAPLSGDQLIEIFGTPTPTGDAISRTLLASGAGQDVEIAVIEKRDAFWNQIGRGQSRYIVAFGDDKAPVQLFFAGISFD